MSERAYPRPPGDGRPCTDTHCFLSPAVDVSSPPCCIPARPKKLQTGMKYLLFYPPPRSKDQFSSSLDIPEQQSKSAPKRVFRRWEYIVENALKSCRFGAGTASSLRCSSQSRFPNRSGLRMGTTQIILRCIMPPHGHKIFENRGGGGGAKLTQNTTPPGLPSGPIFSVVDFFSKRSDHNQSQTLLLKEAGCSDAISFSLCCSSLALEKKVVYFLGLLRY